MYGEIAYLLEPLSEEEKEKCQVMKKIDRLYQCETDHRVY